MAADGQAGGAQHDVATVFRHHAQYVCRLLRRFGVAERDVPDACQDVFLVVMRKLPEFEGRSALPTWLYRICLRTASDYRKRAHRRHERLQARIPERIAPARQAQQQQLQEAARLVERALSTLSERARAVFVLYELEQRPMTEVADIVGCPLKTAFSRLYTARRQVNSTLRRSGLAGAFCISPLAVPLPAMQLEPSLRVVLEQVGGGVTPAPELVLSLGKLAAGSSLHAAAIAGAKLAAPLAASALSAWLVVSASLLQPPDGATFVSEELAFREEQLPAPRFVSLPHERRQVTAPKSPPVRRPCSTPTPRATTCNETATPWLYAERPAPPAQADTRAKHGPIGLDAVLDATNVRSLMRIGPAASQVAQRNVVLVPTRQRTQRSH